MRGLVLMNLHVAIGDGLDLGPLLMLLHVERLSFPAGEKKRGKKEREKKEE